jgi:hypothetical protein
LTVHCLKTKTAQLKLIKTRIIPSAVSKIVRCPTAKIKYKSHIIYPLTTILLSSYKLDLADNKVVIMPIDAQTGILFLIP